MSRFSQSDADVKKLWRKVNRNQKKNPRGRSHWCKSCDGARVNDGSKCRACGGREFPRREKP